MEDQKNKRYKFSPSNIEQIEKETLDRLCGTEDRYRVPETFKGKEPRIWELLHKQFPANSTLQDAAQLFMFQLNYRGCPLYYTCMQCECPNCTDMKQEYIPYAHSVMYDQELYAIATPGKVREMPDTLCVHTQLHYKLARKHLYFHEFCYDIIFLLAREWTL